MADVLGVLVAVAYEPAVLAAAEKCYWNARVAPEKLAEKLRKRCHLKRETIYTEKAIPETNLRLTMSERHSRRRQCSRLGHRAFDSLRPRLGRRTSLSAAGVRCQAVPVRIKAHHCV